MTMFWGDWDLVPKMPQHPPSHTHTHPHPQALKHTHNTFLTSCSNLKHTKPGKHSIRDFAFFSPLLFLLFSLSLFLASNPAPAAIGRHFDPPVA
jgi:hypothetical protein